MPQSRPDATRNRALDIAKGIGILTVCYGHGLEIAIKGRPDGFFSAFYFDQIKFLYSFNMPLFFFLSGMLSRHLLDRTPRQVATRCLYYVFVAYAVHLLASLILYTAAEPPETLREVLLSLKDTVFPLIKGTWFHTYVVWFLVSIAGVQFLYYAWFRLGRPGKALAAAACAVAIVFMACDITSYWQLRALIPGTAFYVIGAIVVRLPRRPLPVAAFLLAVAYFTAPYNHGCAVSLSEVCPEDGLHGRFVVWMISGDIGNIPMFLLTAITGMIAVFDLSRFLAKFRIAAPLAYVGAHSLELLLINGFVLLFANRILATLPYPGRTVFLLGVVGLVLAQVALLGLLLRPILACEERLRRAAERTAAILPLPAFVRREDSRTAPRQ